MKSIKKIAILGSTGSIGKTVLKILSKNKNKFKILLLTANKNYKELLKQTKIFNVQNVIITNGQALQKFKKYNKNPNINIFSDYNCYKKVFKTKIDYVMSSIVGIQGLEPTIKIIKYTKLIAIANKESVICGWNLIKNELEKNKTKVIPVDSEHFSIWFASNNVNIHHVILTASGGALLNYSDVMLKNIKIKDVLKHPNWKMGNKITVDSSTLMNKVFEVIEAKNIFNISLDQISVIIHPSSYIHAIVKFDNGMIKIIAHDTTMEIPIFNSIYENKKKYHKIKNIDTDVLNNLNFQKVNYKKFPLIKILDLIPEKISLFETILVSANDEIVKMYLKGEIDYRDISKKLLSFIKNKKFTKYKKKTPRTLSEINALDRYVRFKLNPKGV